MAKTAYETVTAARSKDKVATADLINNIFSNFTEFHGDRQLSDDPAVIGGIALLNGIPVTVIGTQKGKNTAENIERHFGTVEPEGYRKAVRLMQQAEKFKRPVITFVNTPGAYPGMDAEYHGQGSAIANSLIVGMELRVPYISIIVGEGGSGGALALATGDTVWMMENSIYSVLSPEGYASIVWKDSKRVIEASEALKLTPEHLLEDGIIDKIVPEVVDQTSTQNLKQMLVTEVNRLSQFSADELVQRRHERFSKF
ncbi:carboxyltransferase subunit alpha [Pediococcus pentosaceus]|jgi:acetyl-CoA carboxylase carboxyl transferase subunit alpha|uniref:carboxyltransferase subunit alpha n=1 Tax=Pediococcus pentosaceus TaxID=1255 RepID=UPI00191A611F|nr:carboxyltransferase subunit alpha [Pediococcus pentosaceus]MCH3989044.1 acetyl-CoA carboxylase carboxyl transferase subunit alpha [Pediococcus pentosaceus]MCH4015287.1 acetyl-CoA carboxylase carboxyl transferase subunit alpha [Pediococcus pentosaceus]MCH4059254.1 acetyl-CoA carboxylase carboxyl transferase subunit alpha [Pediococcus pentosaceus]MCI1472775.1 acetyl-CoA carboxylase carboxyl transferase subunit alpha [Pediococcus pentosaceus]MCQ0028021.1 acetyl-CoA carboxylase carboxyl transfe